MTSLSNRSGFPPEPRDEGWTATQWFGEGWEHLEEQV